MTIKLDHLWSLFLSICFHNLDLLSNELFTGDLQGTISKNSIWEDHKALHNNLCATFSVFNFTTGEEDVARVTREAFLTCNSTNPISLKTTGPANFTLDTLGEYYFIGTLDKHCILGQRLAINVTAHSEPTPAPTPPPAPAPREPKNYTVGDKLGWLIPPPDPLGLFYASWAYNKTFLVGDTLSKCRFH